MKLVSAMTVMTNTLTAESGMDAAEARQIVRLLVANQLHCRLSELGWHLTDEIELADYASALAALAAGEPVQYLLGETEFMGLPFRCRPGVLIPRMDSEPVLEAAIALAENTDARQICDLCTGSGTYALVLARYLPKAQVVGVDLAAVPLALAVENAALLQVEPRVEFLLGDLFAPLAGRQFDLIVCNPPYVPSAEIAQLSLQVQREPVLALDGGADGLNYFRRLACESSPYLKPGGFMVLEHGEDQHAAIACLLTEAGFTVGQMIRDYGGRERGLIAQWKAGD